MTCPKYDHEEFKAEFYSRFDMSKQATTEALRAALEALRKHPSSPTALTVLRRLAATRIVWYGSDVALKSEIARALKEYPS